MQDEPDATSGSGLAIRDISKRYGDLVAVDGLSFDVPQGSLVGFLGPNGAGKTTTMRAIVQMVKLDRGEILWDGDPVDQAALNRIGYMPQERGIYARMKVREQVTYFGRLAGLNKAVASEQADYWLEQVGLTDRANDLVQELSGGNQQRVQLAVSLVHDPDLLILDEPFAGLDPIAAETMRDIIAGRAEAGKCVLFSSHQLDLVEDLCEQVMIIASGRKVAAGAIAELRSASPNRQLRVRWKDPIDRWDPLVGTVRTFDGYSAEVELPSTADFGASIAHAVAAGPVSEVGIEAPGLGEVFSELVGVPAERGEP